jgi:hypothetical protein
MGRFEPILILIMLLFWALGVIGIMFSITSLQACFFAEIAVCFVFFVRHAILLICEN